MKNITTSTDDWCLNGTWKKWADMTAHEKSAKLKSSLEIAQATGDKAKENYWLTVINTVKH